MGEGHVYADGRTAVARFVASVLLVSAALVQAQTANAQTTSQGAPAAAPADTSLTFHGITLYGIVDLGVQYDTHGAPINDYFPATAESFIQKNGNNSVVGVASNNLSQSRIGLTGSEALGVGDWSAVFRLETFFNPQSGDISDALKAVTQNNGKALAQQSTNADSSVAGQLFGGAAYGGFSSPTYGTVTFGRHVTLLADGIAKYDPNAASQAFSVIGWAGTTAGGGDTEDRRLDQSLKYTLKYQHLHVGALYKFNGATSAAGTAFQAQLGADLGAGSVDLYYTERKDAIAASALSAAQVATLPTLGFSSSNALAATISDNSSFAVMGSYSFGAPKVFAGYEYMEYKNPSTPLAVGSTTLGGYVLAVVNNAAFAKHKTLQVGWAGVKYSVSPHLDLTGAWYGYKQNSYATGTATVNGVPGVSLSGCSSTVSGACSGTLNAFAFDADYVFTKRFDFYIGGMWSGVKDGLANGYLNKNSVSTTLGVRFKF